MLARVIGALLISMLLGGSADAKAVPGLDRIETPPAGWSGPVFVPRFDFPERPAAETYPWQALNFRSEPERYLRVMLDYALAGQDRQHWRLQANAVRGWYHVPWLGPGAQGREFVHGLTRARDFAPGELGAAQRHCRQNWALAFYNDQGGAVLGKIWGRGGSDPNLNALPFPPGTLAVKLVFTQATVTDDSRLAGAPELLANIHAGGAGAACARAVDARGKPAARAPQTLRLIQVDVAARETRASYKTGWVFGSFRFDGTKAGNDPWAKLVPMGLMWGNDPQLSDAAAAAGEKPRQSVVFDAGVGFGRGGRMNGVADERASACSSCHMAAQWPSVAPMTAPADWAAAKCWFRNLDARYTFGFPPGVQGGCADPTALEKIWPLDFSLQLTVAVRNWAMEKARRGRPVQTMIGKLTRRGERLDVNGIHALPLKR
ncbi:MAG: hypothetical protein KBA31_07940 [Alphaproteobacteria bacterium]|nr:hypothetical protein [Alphaproteobacteria bacterium]